MESEDRSTGVGDPSAASTSTAAPSASAFPSDGIEVPAALREDQIQNAVTFLSHPKVRGSAESSKRAFLEKKGLTSAEIDEAFKRVPPEAPAVGTSSTPTVGANNLVTYTQQPQTVVHATHQAPQHPSQALVPAQTLQLQPQRPPVHWAQVVLGVGVAAAGVYGLHQLLAPRLSAWSQHLFASRKAAAEAEAERTAALTTALERLSEGQARLQDTLEALTFAMRDQQQQQRQQTEQYGTAGSTADYLACQSPALGKRTFHQQQPYGGGSYYGGGAPHSTHSDASASASRAAVVRGAAWDPAVPDYSYRSGYEPRPRSRDNTATGAAGGAPSGFYGSSATGFEVTPPPHGNYRAPQPPAHYQQQQQSEQYGAASSTNGYAGADPGYSRRAGAYAEPEVTPGSGRPGGSSVSRPEEAPRSAAFEEVMAMVQAGITPPNVRTDINDAPPDPSRPLSAPNIPPRTKPWESNTVSSNGYGTPSAAYSSNVVPDGPSGFGVRGYGGPPPPPAAAAAGALTPTSGRDDTRMEPGVAAGSTGGEGVGTSSSPYDAPKEQPRVGYDLSNLFGADAARDAPWRPPPPPAATVQRPVSSSSAADNSSSMAPAESAPAAVTDAAVSAAGPADALPSAASAPAAAAVMPEAAGGVAVVAEVVDAVAAGQETAVEATA